MPRCSVVIPTRNRPDLVVAAVRSALAQTLEDLEVVVSDNSSDESTARALRAFTDERLRVVRTPRSLLMHDSWQFALEQSRGALTTFLCDDDALLPGAMEIGAGAMDETGAEVIAWRACTLYAADWIVPADRGRLRFGAPYSDARLRLDGARLLDCAYALRITTTDRVPKMLNCLVRRAALDRAAAQGVRLFRPSCPDYSAMAGLSVIARGMMLLDAPLLVSGATPMSIGATAAHDGSAARRFVEELLEGEPDLVLPEVLGPAESWIAQTLMQCAHEHTALRGRRIDPVHLDGLIGVEVARGRRSGIALEDLATAWRRHIDGAPAAHASAVRAFVAAPPLLETESFIDQAPRSAGGSETERVLGIGPFTARDTFTAEIGCATIDEVASRIPGWLRRHFVPLDPWLDRARSGAGDRAIVLYGGGENGRALGRLLAGRDGSSPVMLCDDAPALNAGDEPPRCAPEELDLARHFVIVTPSDPGRMHERLTARGFVCGRDWMDYSSLVRGVAAQR